MLTPLPRWVAQARQSESPSKQLGLLWICSTQGILRRYPKTRFRVAHCGGAFPMLSGLLKLLGTELWVPNPNKIKQDEIREQLAGLYLYTAATAPTGMAPALRMVSPDHLVYGADCGVPCSTESTMEANKKAVLDYDDLSKEQRDATGRNVMSLFPAATGRLKRKDGVPN